MLKIKNIALALVIEFVFFALSAWLQQPRHFSSVPDLFNQEAAASDPVGIHKYGRDLVDLILPNQCTDGQSPSGRMEIFQVEFLGEKYAAKFADRLVRTEQMARAGNGKLVPEASVVKAYNNLMWKVGAPQSYQTNEEDLHKFRARAAVLSAFSALFTANRNGSNCYPGEAVFLLYFLISNNGQLSENLVDDLTKTQRWAELASGPIQSYGSQYPRVGSDASGSRRALFSYCSRRHHRATALFNNMAKTLGI